VAKATLYRHFPTKEHLIAAYLEARNERSLSNMNTAIASNNGTRHPVLVLFDNLAERGASSDFHGCAFMIAVSEQRDSALVRGVSQRHKSAVRELFRGLLANDFEDPERLAHQLAIIFDGALASVLIEGAGHNIHHATDLAATLLTVRRSHHGADC